MKRIAVLLTAFFLTLSGISMAGGPEGVSPSGQDVAVINDVCPTFSWTEADGAVGYRVEVYEAVGDLLTHDDVASVAEPVISVDAGRALSWTPSEGGCLTPGMRYVWYVGMKSQNKEIIWSSGRVFEVSSALTEAGREEVKEMVEGYLTNEWKTTDSYTQVKEEIKKEITGGSGLSSRGSISIMGSEGDTNHNTYYGTGAGANLDGTGNHNAFFGYYAGYNTTSGDYNTFMGDYAGSSNTTGSENTFIGDYAGYDNTTGDYNTFMGGSAGSLNTTGDQNTFMGLDAGYHNTTGFDNTFTGYRAGYYSRTSENTFVGKYAGRGQYNSGNFSTGTGNAFFGLEAGRDFTSAYYNTFMGYRAGICVETADQNTFVGYGAGSGYDWGSNSCNSTRPSGSKNTIIGYQSGNNLTTGYYNTFMGYKVGYSNTEGYSNTFMGIFTGYYNTTGHHNTFLGRSAGYTNSTGSRNVFLGYEAGYNETGSDRLYIDNSNTSSPLIYGEFDTDKLQVNGNLTVIGPYQGLVYLSDNTTNNTTKVSRMVLTHYDTSELPVYLFGAASTATDNFVAFGGGSPIGNAATQIDLFTAPDTTTPVGTPRLTIKGNGYIGIGTQTPSYPLEMASGAHVTTGGVWTNASSREYKENIEPLTLREAMDALNGLDPVKFNYKVDKEERYVGFIAEDVPELVATKDRKSLSSMDIVAVLTKVVKEQKEEIRQQRTENRQQTEKIKEMTDKINALEAENQEIKAENQEIKAENRQIKAENQEIRAELLEKIATLERQIKLMNTVASR